MSHCDQGCQKAANEQRREGHASPPQLPLSKHFHNRIPPPGVVLKQSLQLEHGTQGQEGVEDLVSLAYKVTPAREEALWDGTGEEEGRQEERGNLEGMEVL